MGQDTTDKHAHLQMTMALRYLEVQLKQLDSHGFPRAEALAALDLNEADFYDLNRRIEVRRVDHMYQVAAKKLSDPYIALKLGNKFRFNDYSETGSVFTYCDNLAHVFEMMGRYQRLAVDIATPEYRVEDGRHYFIFNPYDEVQNMHHVMAALLGAYATAFRWFCWASGYDLIEVALMPPGPDNIQEYVEAMQCPVIFGSPRNHAEFHPESIHAPLLTRNPEKLARDIVILDKLLKRGNESENFKMAVTASIRSAMERGAVNLSIVAARMNLSERNLRQKLSTEEVNFRHLLDGERKEVFKELHEQGESFAAISQALAYNDQAAFNRAFKRWYGITPSQYDARQS